MRNIFKQPKVCASLFASILTVMMVCQPTSASRARTCRNLFGAEAEKTRIIFQELAELHLAANDKENVILRTVSERDFKQRYNEMIERLGEPETQRILRMEVRRFRAARSAENQEREKRQSRERKVIGPAQVRPKLMKDLEGQIVSLDYDSGGLPDGGFEFLPSRGNKAELLSLNAEKPCYEKKEIPLPDFEYRKISEFESKWRVKNLNGRMIAIARRNGKILLWDMGKGPKAIFSLSDGNQISMSPNGRYIVAHDQSGLLRRLDLDSGEIREYGLVALLVGAWVRNDGSISFWDKNGEGVELDKNLKYVSETSLTKKFGTKGSFLHAGASPDQTQAVFLSTAGGVVLVDFVQNKHRVYPSSGDGIRSVIWRDRTVWVTSIRSSVLRPIPRDFSDAPDVYVKESVLDRNGHYDGLINYDAFKKQTVLRVSNLNAADQKTLPLSAEIIAMTTYTTGWPTGLPSITNDGRLAAISGGDHKVIFFDIEKEVVVEVLDIGKENEITAPLRWSADGLSFLLETRIRGTSDQPHVQIWQLDGTEVE